MFIILSLFFQVCFANNAVAFVVCAICGSTRSSLTRSSNVAPQLQQQSFSGSPAPFSGSSALKSAPNPPIVVTIPPGGSKNPLEAKLPTSASPFVKVSTSSSSNSAFAKSVLPHSPTSPNSPSTGSSSNSSMPNTITSVVGAPSTSISPLAQKGKSEGLISDTKIFVGGLSHDTTKKVSKSG
jgi:hypothetical protein